LEKYFKFVGLGLITVAVTYFAADGISSLWYLLLLILYARSKDEPFWLAFFFITTDGFFGFFGLYVTTLKAIPGLPGIELSQFYVIIAFFKAVWSKRRPVLFYSNWLTVLCCYLLFLVIFGIANGLHNELNVYLKVAKFIVPLSLFYTVPRLFSKLSDYRELFGYLFIVTILAFVAQLVTLFTGFDPNLHFRPPVETEMEATIEVGRNFRVLNNQGITLISLFGALFFLIHRGVKEFRRFYLYMIIFICFAMAFLSATRGWIISFGLILAISFLFVIRLRFAQVVSFSILIVGIAVGALSIDKINRQIGFSLERLFTLNSLAHGDVTANSTLIRLTERGPAVMKEWRKSPVFGQGFSDEYLAHSDMHVGNQNLLMHSGIVGFALLFAFLFYFMGNMLLRYHQLRWIHPYAPVFLLFVVFLLGWIFIHSTSGQKFAYHGMPESVLPQTIFLGLSGLMFSGEGSGLWTNRNKKAAGSAGMEKIGLN